MTMNIDYRSPARGSRPELASRRSFHLSMFFFVWLPAALVFTAIIGCMTGVFFSIMGFFLGPVLALFIAYTVRRNQVVIRERRTQALLGYLENAVRLNLPLDRFLAAAEASEHGSMRRMLVTMRSLLNRGFLVGASLEAAASGMDARTIRQLIAEEEIGQLQPALTRLLRRQYRNRPLPSEDNLPYYRFYLVMLLFILPLLGTGMMIFVVPKFLEIFKDFHVALPPVTQFMIDLADFLANGSLVGLLLLVVGGGLLLGAIALMLQRVFTPSVSSALPTRAMQWIMWHTPFLHGLQERRAVADVTEYLADALRAGVPLPAALQQAEGLEMNYHMRRRVAAWRAGLVAGQSPAEAARRARLPEIIAGLLQSGETPRANTTETAAPELFEFVARYYRERFSRLLVLLRGVGEPLTVVAIGAAVVLFVYAMYTPLVTLLNATEGFVNSTNGVL